MMLRCFSLLLMVLPAVLPGGPLIHTTTRPDTQPDGVFLGFAGGPAVVTTPGFHKMIFAWAENGIKHQLPFSIYLPLGYGKDDRHWPMLTFMAGLGDRGTDPGAGMAVGVPAAIGRDPALQKWLPMIVLTPQCPSDKVWDTPGMAQDVLRLVHAVMDQFPVDSSRMYVTGFSDGGKGTWVLAAAEPNLFAVAAPVVSREYQAEQTAKLLSGTGIACLAISGTADDVSEPATAHMVAALRKQKVDVTYVPVPKGKHFIWQAFFTRQEFYQWLLLHRRGQAPPQTRPSDDDFLKLYAAHQNADTQQQVLDWRMQHGLDQLEPYWFVDSCGDKGDPGLRDRLLGHDKVLVTSPLTNDIPCRLQTTRKLPKDKITELDLEIGHPPKGQWELVIRINEQEKLRTLVNDQTAANGWMTVTLSLQDYAGSEARIQLIQNGTGEGSHLAYWDKIKLVEKNAQ